MSYVQSLDLFRFTDARDADAIARIDTQALKTAVLFKVSEVNGWRDVQVFDIDAWSRQPEANEAVWVGIGQRFEQHAFENTEDGRVGPDAEA